VAYIVKSMPSSVSDTGLILLLVYNAKVSARQQCVHKCPYERNLRKGNGRNIMYIRWVTTPSPKIRVYLHSFSSCCLTNLKNPATENSKF